MMLPMLCAFAVILITQTTSGALTPSQRQALNEAVNDSMIAAGKTGVPEGDYWAFLDANRLAESCNKTAVAEEEATSFNYPTDEFSAAIASRDLLAADSPNDAEHISCDAMTCPNMDNQPFIVCAFKVPENEEDTD